MSRRCELTGVGPMIGHNVSHSNTKTKRRFLPALSPSKLHSDALGQNFTLRISNAALRTVDFRGGLDTFLDQAVIRYRPQLETYVALAKGMGTEPVRAGLYFPLLGVFRAVTPS